MLFLCCCHFVLFYHCGNKLLLIRIPEVFMCFTQQPPGEAPQTAVPLTATRGSNSESVLTGAHVEISNCTAEINMFIRHIMLVSVRFMGLTDGRGGTDTPVLDYGASLEGNPAWWVLTSLRDSTHIHCCCFWHQFVSCWFNVIHIGGSMKT